MLGSTSVVKQTAAAQLAVPLKADKKKNESSKKSHLIQQVFISFKLG